MKHAILGIDCAMRWTSIGLVAENRLLGEINIDLGKQQAEKLPLLVAHLLESCCVSLSDIAQIAVTQGPGYYTGIRVGLAYACALAEGLAVSLIPIPTLYPLVRGLNGLAADRVALLRARRSAVYAAFYKQGEPVECVAPEYLSEEEAAIKIAELYSPLLVGHADLLASPLFCGYPSLIKEASGGGDVALSAIDLQHLASAPNQVHAEYLRAPDFGAH